MKNIILIAIIILTFFISCRKSTLKITEPGASFFLDKMKGGDYTNGNDSFNVSNDGKNITIGNGSNTNNYTFESDIMGIGGIYQGNNSSNYIGVFPFGDTMHTVTMGKKEKEAVTKIIEVVGKEDSLKVIEGLSKVNGGKLDTEAITKNLDANKKAEVEKIIKDSGLDKNKFGDYKEYKKT
ncbi:hypothetical protein EPJ74_03955 [Brachyspira aalborgi]|uniref:Uncharacterized protein n=1 Tax=Brachyspira aalborgi TaxID=29522 RepID=A0A5C8GHG5_9SPIR|nr:hypothetical protein [Brachyspira aalborgi]TXJ61391.1 hypothetical protein EPJ74_03955 [Brachyspira aalborgi]